MFGETVVQQPEISFSGLAQGSYVLKVRGIDEFGLEGRDAIAVIGMLPENAPMLLPPRAGKSAPTLASVR